MIRSMKEVLLKLREGWSLVEDDGRWTVQIDCAEIEVSRHVAQSLEDRGYVVVLSTRRTLVISQLHKDPPSLASRRRFGMVTL